MILPFDALRRRVSRLQALLAYLDRQPTVSLEAYTADIDLQLRIERVLQLSTQIAVDVGESLLDHATVHGPAPSAPRTGAEPKGFLARLSERGIVPAPLAARLSDLAAIASVLVHENTEIDPRMVWRLWTERRADLIGLAAAYSAHLNRPREGARL